MGKVIKSLYQDYFQKSRVFLYPALDIKRGGSVTPIETYMHWKNYYGFEDCKLICLYYLRNDEDFKQFEKLKLLGNKLFHDFKQVEESKGVYVFDLNSIKADFKSILIGKYSKISNEHKVKIKNFIGINSPHSPYVESFLHPEKYFKLYAEMMNVEENLLREVGELCTPPDHEKEEAKVSIINLEFIKKTS